METARAGKDTNTNVYEKYGKYVHTNTEKYNFYLQIQMRIQMFSSDNCLSSLLGNNLEWTLRTERGLTHRHGGLSLCTETLCHWHISMVDFNALHALPLFHCALCTDTDTRWTLTN